MTDYVTEMMKTAGVTYYDRYYRCIDNSVDEIKCKKSCDCCDKSKEVFCYPDFTAEKQLELIKIIGKKYRFSTFTNIFSDNSVQYYCETKQPRIYHRAQAKDFTQALAQLTTKLMNAGKLDKNSVKSILED